MLFVPAVASAQFAGGDGSASNPWLVATATQLDAVRTNLTAHFRQTSDIDLGVAPWNDGSGWVPIGTSAGGQRFTGTYDGHGHAILNLTIDRSGSSDQGLFGYTQNATIRRCWLADVNVRGGGYSAALAGRAETSTIEHIRINGTVNGTTRVGGLLGLVNAGAIHAVAVDAAVSGTSDVGGLVGYAQSALTIVACHTAGSVSGTDRVGGFVGYLSSGWIVDGSSRASVAATGDAGGFAGSLGGGNAHLLRVFSTGAVNGTGTHTGGLLGFYAGGTVNDAFWDRQTSERMWSARGMGRSTAEMRQQATFAAFNFQTLWSIEEGVDYPAFRDLSGYAAAPVAVDLATLDGDGSAGDPYIITTADELNAMRQNLAAHYRLGNDIDLSASVTWDAGRGWTPVGASTAGQRFTGSLDGNGHAILNLTVTRPTTDYQGLFGYTEYATLRRLQLTDAHVTGAGYSGMLAGHALGNAVEHVTVTGRVRGTQRTGGLLGSMGGGGLLACAVDARVQGTIYTGGLIGETLWASGPGNPGIRYCHSRGTVSGTDDVGGLVGRFSSGTHLADAYSHAAVSGVNRVGGLAGHMISNAGYLHRGYSAGAVSGTGTDIGGLIGGFSSGTLAESYWDIESSGQAASGGSGATGKTTAAMQQRETYAQFNFATAWRIDEGNDYPVFRDLSGYAAPGTVDLAALDGDGSEGNPYILTTADELHAMRQNLAAHYRLGNDIDLAATVAWDLGCGWTPVGDASTRFTGSLDGAGHTLRYLSVNRGAAEYQGLFGQTENATIRRLSLQQAMVHGHNRTGGVAGQAIDSVIDSVELTGTVTGRSYTGGLVALLSGGRLRGVSATVAVRGTSFTGGLVGATSAPVAGGSIVRPTIYHAWTAGTVLGGDTTGGLVGQHASGIISDSYSLAATTGANHVGGLVGTMQHSIFRGFSAGAVSGTGTAVGGLVGTLDEYNAPLRRHCFWDTETSGQTASGAGTGLTTAEMRQQATYAFYDFHTLWNIEEDLTYPAFQDLSAYAEPQTLALEDLAGSGTEGDPYVITTADELNAMRLGLDKYYRLDNDIDLAATVVWNQGRGWDPVGISDLGQRFTGVLDGGSNTIRNLTINRPRTATQGLFGYLQDAGIQNLRIEQANLQCAGNAGALAAASSGAVVEDVSMSGQVTAGYGSYVGGLLGQNSNAQLKRVSAAARVAGTTGVGGLLGYFGPLDSVLEDGYALGSVEGTTQVGGLIGYMAGATMSNSYSRASVDGADNIGGLVGLASGCALKRSYSSGAVDGTGDNIGGMIGSSSSSSSYYCYWDKDSSGQDTSALGTGKTTAEMWQQATYGVDLNPWDFTTVWDIEEDVGYPVLRLTPQTLAIAPDSRRHGAAAVTGQTFEVTANVAWTAAANETWIEVTAGAVGTNDGVVVYSLEAYAGTGARAGSITVSDGNGLEQTFAIAQEAVLMVNPAAQWHDAAASAGHTVTVDGNLDWTAGAVESWIVVTGGAAGSSAGTVTYRVEANTARTPRSGSLVVDGGGLSCTVAVHQAAAPAYLTLTPAMREHAGDASAGHTVAVAANDAWTAVSTNAWIVVTGGATGSGDGTVTYSVAANPTNAARWGAILVSSNPAEIFRVYQSPAATILVSSAPEAGGTVGGGGLYAVGAPVSVTALPGSGYSFQRWTEGGATVSTDATYDFTAADDRALVAHFCVGETDYTIELSADPTAGGTVSGGGTHRQCSSVTVTAVPNSGYSFQRWTEDGSEVSTDAAYTFTVAGERTLTANFCVGEADYDITVAADPPAGGTVAGGGSYRQCSHVTVTAAPAYRHYFVGWFEGAVQVSADAEYGFTADAHRTLTAVFEFDFAGGTGTASDPFLVATAKQLDRVRGDLDAHFLQVADIDLGVAPWNTDTGWAPLGILSDGYRFVGSYDGGGHTISNLTIVRPAATYQGLFGYLQGATVGSLRLAGVQVQGANYTAPLAGYVNVGTIEELRIDGSVQGATYTGGLVGLALNTTVTDARFTGTVQGTSQTGGLAGNFSGGSLHRASAAVTVTGSSYVGGLVGYAFGTASIRFAATLGSVTGSGNEVGGLVGRILNSPTLADSYSRATVRGGASVGGLVGYASGNIYRSYSAGAVAGTGANVGGFHGAVGYGTRTDNYWDTETSGQATSADGVGVVGRSTAAMKQQANYAAWNFASLWRIAEGQDYPVFQLVDGSSAPVPVDLDALDGDGSEGNPYIITNADELHAMRQNLAAHYRLGNDIDLTVASDWHEGQGWLPVGENTAGFRFTGQLDGAGYAIRNLTLSRPGLNYQGLFGVLENATIRNLRLVDAHVHGAAYTAILVGYSVNSTIEEVRVTGVVRGTSDTGGLAGYFSGGSLQRVGAVVTVDGTTRIGGLVGYPLGNATLQFVHSSGSVSGSGNEIGGLIGFIGYYSSATTSDAYSRAAVSGADRVGGLVGYAAGSITRAYSTGAVTGTGANVGGFLGALGGGTQTDNYWDTTTSGQALSAGGAGVVGKTTAEMMQQATFENWDFDAVWAIDAGNDCPTLLGFASWTELDLTPGSRAHASTASAGHAIAVSADTAWTATADDGWITIASGAAGNGDGTILYDLAAHAGDEGRMGTITVSGGDRTRIFRVEQIASRHLLVYSASPGGTLDGPVIQWVAHGGDGEAITAQADGGAQFGAWSDGGVVAARTDQNVTATIAVNARFVSQSGVPIEWYFNSNLLRSGSQTWADIDQADKDLDGVVNWKEYIADTDPNDKNSYLRVTGIEPGVPVTVIFEPASAARDFTLEYRDDLIEGDWAPVPDQGPRPGGGGPDAFEDDDAPAARFYRINVRLP